LIEKKKEKEKSENSEKKKEKREKKMCCSRDLNSRRKMLGDQRNRDVIGKERCGCCWISSTAPSCGAGGLNRQNFLKIGGI